MRFGLMLDFRNPLQWRRPFPDFYAALLDQATRAEALGYDHIWLTEHHFTEDGYNPALMASCAALAARTERIRIGTFVLILPYQHPVRVAEDIACVDIFSNGRFEFGVGQGYSHYEWDALCMDRSSRGRRTREGLEIIEQLFSGEPVTYDGEFTRIKDLRLSPLPVQQPRPPIWIGARGPKAIRRAAESGYHLMATIGPDPAPLYRETLAACGRDPDAFRVSQLRFAYVAETEDAAWAECQDHLFHLLDFYQNILSEANDVEGDDRPLQVTCGADIRHSPLADHFLIGTPDQVSAKLASFREAHFCTDLVLGMQLPGIDPALATRSMELFAHTVMPTFRDD